MSVTNGLAVAAVDNGQCLKRSGGRADPHHDSPLLVDFKFLAQPQRLARPQVVKACLVDNRGVREAKAMPKMRARYLVRSPVSMRNASQFMGVPPESLPPTGRAARGCTPRARL